MVTLMNTEPISKEKSEKKFKAKNITILLFFVEIAALLTAIALIIVATSSVNSWLFFRIGIGIFFGVIGSSMLLITIGIRSGAISGRMGKYRRSGDLDPRTAPYPTSSHPRSKSTKTYLCEFCGYKVSKKESKCPECGGPIKEG